MTLDLIHLYAAATWPACFAILFIACCRLNAMPNNTRFPVVVEYAIWMGIGVAVPLLPFIGEWPGIGTVLLMYALTLVLLCSRRAWAGDVAPDEATDVTPLERLSVRQRIELLTAHTIAKAQAWWLSHRLWKD